MNIANMQPALNPHLGHTRGSQRPLTAREQRQQAQAICAAQGDPRADFQGEPLSCSGTIFVGVFFDGTGNNEEEDFKKIQTHASKIIAMSCACITHIQIR